MDYESYDLPELYRHLQEYVNDITEKRKSKKYNCPLCNSGKRENGTPAFNLYDNGLKCHCHSCGFDGNIIGLYLATNDMSDTKENVAVAIRALGKMYGLASSGQQKAPKTKKNRTKTGERKHIYKNADGSIFGKKTIVSYSDGTKEPYWSLLDPKTGNYINGLNGQKAPLYNADILYSNPDEPVYITEGEKDAETIARFEGIATTIPNGAGFSQWIPLYSEGLQGRDIIILTDNDEPGRKYGDKVAKNVLSIAKSVKVIPATAIWSNCPEKGDISDIAQALGDDETIQRLTTAIQKASFYVPVQEQPPLSEQEIIPLKVKKGYEFEKKNIRYIWYPYIPAGDYTVLMAAGGTGKTYFACGVAATISRGDALPVPPEYSRKNVIQENRNVLIISAEDRGSDIWERLEKSGADVEHIGIVDKSNSNGFLFPKDGSDSIRIQILEKTIEKHKPNLIIIDPWHAFCPPEIDVNRINHVRPVFQTLSAICDKYDCGLILISHVNKKSQENANNAALGSVDLVNASRSALTVISDGRDQNSRIVVQTKSNHAAHGQSVKFTIDDNGFTWNGFEPGLTKDTLEEAAKMHRKPTDLIKDTPDYTEIREELLELITELAEPGKETKIAYQQLENMCEHETFGTLKTTEKKKLIEQVANSEAFKSRGLTLTEYIQGISYTNSQGNKKRGKGFIIRCVVTPQEMAAAMPRK